MGNFTELQLAFKQAVQGARGRCWFCRLHVLVQPMERIEGGLTQIESRVLREAAAGSGATRVVVWEGGALNDDEVREQLARAR